MSVGNKQHWCYVATEEMHCGGATETAWYWSKWPGPLIYCKITVRSAVVYPDSPLFVVLHIWSFCCILCLRLSMMEYLSNSSLISVLDYVRQHFIDFLQLPRHKQMALAEKAIDVLVSTKSLWIFNISWLRLMQWNISLNFHSDPGELCPHLVAHFFTKVLSFSWNKTTLIEILLYYRKMQKCISKKGGGLCGCGLVFNLINLCCDAKLNFLHYYSSLQCNMIL